MGEIYIDSLNSTTARTITHTSFIRGGDFWELLLFASRYDAAVDDRPVICIGIVHVWTPATNLLHQQMRC